MIIGLQAALAALVLMLLPCAWRAFKGPSIADRLQAIDAITVLLIAIIIVLTVLSGVGLFVDVALGLAAFGFVATVGAARFLAEGKVF